MNRKAWWLAVAAMGWVLASVGGLYVITERLDYSTRREDQLAEFRHSGLKLYYEWWEACFFNGQPKKDVVDQELVVAGGRANQWRVKVHALLEQHYGKAVAIEFNTPRMHEPSPPNRSLAACPVNVEIVQHGYRLDRLGDILIRERGRR